MRGELTPFEAVLRLELRLQRREPLTWLYLLVFTALTAGFVGSDTVALVPVAVRGAATATTPMVLALAMSGLAAFGQVITTMVSITAQLRDVAGRTAGLRLATPVAMPALVGGRTVAVVLLLCIVTLGMPLGAIVGSLPHPERLASALPRAMETWALVVLPTVLLTAGLHALVAARASSVYALLITSMTLVVAWQLATTPTVVTAVGEWVVWGDPFGSAPLLAAARATPAAIGSLDPWTPPVLIQRALVAVTGALTMMAATRLTRRAERTRLSGDVIVPRAIATAGAPPSPARPTWWGAVAATTRFTVWSTVRERGFALVAALGAANVAVNVWTAPTDATPAAQQALVLASTHGRLFLILLATIYAGELVWRARDARVDGLLDATPASGSARALGGIAGLLLAELVVSSVLLSAALLPAVMQAAWYRIPSVAAVLTWVLLVHWIPFGVLTLLSLAVHTIVRQKVMAHLLLITGWIIAVVLDAQGIDARWARVLDGPLAAWLAAPAAGPSLAWVTLHGALVGLWAGTIAVTCWPRGVAWRSPPASTRAIGLVLTATALVVLSATQLVDRLPPPTPSEQHAAAP